MTDYIGPFNGQDKNSQPIEKAVHDNGYQLDVHSIFYTIQGEGPLCGTPAVFIRLAGCNLQCPMCDTEYTSGRQHMHLDEIAEAAAAVRRASGAKTPARPAPLIVLTGGEPFRQNVAPLLRMLVSLGWHVQIETNGTLPPPDQVRYKPALSREAGVSIVCSPKTPKLNGIITSRACAFKYVLTHGEIDERDGLPLAVLGLTKPPARPVGFDGPIYVQPADEQDDHSNKLNTVEALLSAMKYGYIFQAQIHKLVDME